MVILLRLRSATPEEPTALEMPPPNMSERPPPLPLCMRTVSTRKIEVRISTTWRAIVSAVTKGPIGGGEMSWNRITDGGAPPGCAAIRRQAVTWCWYRTIAANSSASSDAPPTSAPSTSAPSMMDATLEDLTDPP